jgi:hypothetical protein
MATIEAHALARTPQLILEYRREVDEAWDAYRKAKRAAKKAGISEPRPPKVGTWGHQQRWFQQRLRAARKEDVW